jgi:FAD dependent oxidoreductase TIGR03364
VERTEIAIVGAGIIGLAHAYAFARRGRKVTVIERSPAANGASVRNFGMIWTIGQPPEMRPLAVESNRLWREILSAAGLWHEAAGCLHLAYSDDEWAVMQEFDETGREYGYRTELLSPEEVGAKAQGVRQDHLRGGLFSPEEVCVDPREVVARLPDFLSREYGVRFDFGRAATACETGCLAGFDWRLEADEIVVCSGDDYETLFPAQFAQAGLTRCRLQMLRARPANGSMRIGPMLCSGLTLLHYKNFQVCTTLSDLRERVERERPAYLRHGVHLLVSQHATGEITIGDSHHYGPIALPFNDVEVENLILAELARFLDWGSWELTQRWQGVYSVFPGGPFFEAEPLPGVRVLTGVGGAGMTLSMGLGERTATRIPAGV